MIKHYVHRTCRYCRSIVEKEKVSKNRFDQVREKLNTVIKMQGEVCTLVVEARCGRCSEELFLKLA